MRVEEFSTRYQDRSEAERFVKTWELEQHRIRLASIEAKQIAADKFKITGQSDVLPDWARAVWKDAKRRSAASGIVFDLGEREMAALVSRAAGRCEVSGIEFGSGKITQTYHRPFVASLDRVNAAAGYTLENCRLVIVAVNVAINQWGEEIFIQVCRAVARRNAHRGKRATIPAQPLPSRLVSRRSKPSPNVRLCDDPDSAITGQKAPKTLAADGGRDRD